MAQQERIGKGYPQLLNWLSNDWLNQGPTVCFVEGFSGTGKSSIARDVMQTSDLNVVMVEMPENSSVDDFHLLLAQELSDVGYEELVNAVDTGESLENALAKLLRKPVLIVIDEFQRALLLNLGKPIKKFERILARIANRPNLPGRILLLTNQLVERALVQPG